LLIAGPTAVGKSAVALALALELGGEIVSVDSMQVYRGMDIGTAKASARERAQVPHHLVDILGVTESFDAAQFVLLATQAIRAIQSRGRVPILCGGTGLYFQALLFGIGQAPPSDPQLRAALEQIPLPALLQELEKADPPCFATIDPANRRRVVRALEVIRLTGRPFSVQRAPWPNGMAEFEGGRPCLIGLTRTRQDLSRRIDARVEAMFAQGLVSEVQALIGQGLTENRTAMQALGYRQVIEHLQGSLSLEQTIGLIKQKTRQFAKRQMTWFSRQLPLNWVTLGEADDTQSVVGQVAQRYALD